MFLPLYNFRCIFAERRIDHAPECPWTDLPRKLGVIEWLLLSPVYKSTEAKEYALKILFWLSLIHCCWNVCTLRKIISLNYVGIQVYCLRKGSLMSLNEFPIWFLDDFNLTGSDFLPGLTLTLEQFRMRSINVRPSQDTLWERSREALIFITDRHARIGQSDDCILKGSRRHWFYELILD